MAKKVLLFGNPNVGKTTIFNNITDSNERVSNFEGVTVQKKIALSTCGDFEFTDVPGINGLISTSEMTKVAIHELLYGELDEIANVIDITNFKKNSYLMLDLLETGRPVSIYFNMYDLFVGEIDLAKMSERLSAKIVVSSNTNKHLNIEEKYKVNDLCEYIVNTFKLDYGLEIEEAIALLEQIVIKNRKNRLSPRFLAIQFLRGNEEVLNFFEEEKFAKKIRSDLEQKILETKQARSINGLFFLKRRNFIADLMVESYHLEKVEQDAAILNKYLDKIALHKYWGFILFLFVMYLIFEISVNFGVLSDYVGLFFEKLSEVITGWLTAIYVPEVIIGFLIDGALAGVGGILGFLPQIIVLFTLLTLLEGIGYFPRVSVLFERAFSKIGLSAHSLIPYISGLGCNVLGIMSTRAIQSENKRIATIMSSPFISCSARLVVYMIFTDAFFSENQALIILFLYVLGTVVAIAYAYVVSKLIFKDNSEMNLIVLPDYRKINLKYLYKMVKAKAKSFIENAGKLILIGSMIIWLISNFGVTGQVTDINDSFLGMVSNVIAPVFIPLGFGTLEATAALFASFPAKELAVSAMIVMYNTDGANLGSVLVSHFNQASALSFLVFTLLYIPCLSTLGVIYSETKKIKYVFYSVASSLLVGYFVSFVVYRIALIIM
ncbi:MAG: ferrous iron transport protein B [Mycoplasmatales bacterium]